MHKKGEKRKVSYTMVCGRQVDDSLEQIKSLNEKRKSLRAQLLFRKNILEQEADKKLFQLVENKKY